MSTRQRLEIQDALRGMESRPSYKVNVQGIADVDKGTRLPCKQPTCTLPVNACPVFMDKAAGGDKTVPAGSLAAICLNLCATKLQQDQK